MMIEEQPAVEDGFLRFALAGFEVPGLFLEKRLVMGALILGDSCRECRKPLLSWPPNAAQWPVMSA